MVRRPARLAALYATGLLDSEADELFDRLTRLAVRLLDVPTSFISLVDEHRDFYVSAFGFGEPLASARELSGPTLCHFAIRSDAPLIIADTAADPLYRTVDSVSALGVVAYIGVPLFIDGEPVGSFCVIDRRAHAWTERDIEILRELASSAQREIALRLSLRRAEEARNEAASANLAKEDFLASVSHELRSPLNGIATNVQMLEMGLCGPVTDPQARALERIRRSSDHLGALISQILQFKRIGAGETRYTLTDVGVASAIEDAAQIMAVQLAEHEVDLVRSGGDLSVTVRADGGMLRQILVNLLDNANRFTEKGGRVSLMCSRTDEAVCIDVRDTGVGIPSAELENIFRPFVQLANASGVSRGGTGLGLSISRELARGMGGDLTVRSTVGEGSQFTLRLASA